MSDRERPWSKFYWSDWDSDQGLRQCSLAAQGLWMRMLVICAKADPRGYLTIAGKPLDVSGLATAVSHPQTEVVTLLAELEGWGVFSRDRAQRIYSRRMVADEKRSKQGAKAKKEALLKSKQHTENTKENPAPSRVATRGASTQKPETRDQIEDNPPAAVTPSPAAAPPQRPSWTKLIDACSEGLKDAGSERPWPPASEATYAQGLEEAGAPPELVRYIAAQVATRNKAQGKPAPGGLAYLDRAIREAMTKPPAPDMPKPATDEANAKALRVLRLRGLIEKGLWQDHWGPRPTIDEAEAEVRGERKAA